MTIGTAFPSREKRLLFDPSGSWNAVNNGTVVTWSTNFINYLADSNDTTWVQAKTSYLTAPVGVGFPNITLGGSAVTRVRAVARVAGGATFDISVGGFSGTSGNATSFTAAGSSTKTYAGGWISSAAGTALGSAVMNDLAVYLGYPTSTAARFAQLRLEYDVVSVPTVGTVVVSPLNTDRPTISWTYSDAEGAAQGSAEVKVYSSAVAAGAGFSPDNPYITPLFGTVVTGAGTSVVAPVSLGPSGTNFRAYVKAVTDKSAVRVPSAWTASAYQQLAFTPPTAPTVTATWDATNRRTSINVRGSADPFRYTLVRSDGETIGTALTTMNAAGSVVVYDYTPARGTSVVYNATITTPGTAALQLTSGTASGTVSVPAATSWEMRSVDDPTGLALFSVPVTSVSWTQYEGLTVFRPLGSTRPVVVAGDLQGDDGSLVITTSSRSQWESVKALVDAQDDFLLTSPFTGSNGTNDRYVIRITSRQWDSDGTTQTPIQRVTLGFVEVD